MLTHRLRDKEHIESFIQKFLLHVANVVIVVVNILTKDDQKLISRIF